MQGGSKRSGWSGHGRTNNRAGNFFYIFFIFLNFLLYFLAGIIIEPGFVSILFLNRDDTVAKMCTLTIRFRPFPSIPCRQSTSFDGWEKPPRARVRWPLQRPSMRCRDYHGGSYICVLQIEHTSEQVSQTVLHVSQTVLQVSQTVLQVSQTVLRWSWQHEWTENVCC